MNDKMIFSIVAIVMVALIQIGAFFTGHNGAVFNFTTLIIGAIVGSVLGFTINLNGSIKSYFKNSSQVEEQSNYNAEMQKNFEDTHK